MNNTMRRHAVAFALAFALAPVYAQPPLSPPLKNWAAPLYWAPTPAEAQQLRVEHRTSLAQAASIFTSPGPMTFIAMTPCRVMDTRGEPYSPLTGSFGPPNLTSGVARSVPMPSSTSCSIPSNAGAYSLNITAISDGGGLLSSLSVCPAGSACPVSTLNDSLAGGVVANAAIVTAGTSGAIQMTAISTTNTDVIVDINGYYAAPSDAGANTGIGLNALLGSSGNYNTATGQNALYGNSGSNNTAAGLEALFANSGNNNTAMGSGAMQNDSSGSNNTAMGSAAMQSHSSGSGNTGVGENALLNNSTGNSNLALGINAGDAIVGGSNNVDIAADGAASDGLAANSGVIRIGTLGMQTSAYIAGISGVTSSGGTEVFVNSNGQLGTTTSSRRFKEDITDMGDASSKLLQLHPVNFFYKPEYDDGSRLLQYGLIAEEVEKVYPEMVAYDNDGQVLSVRYQMLAPMLLNEVQKQAELIRALEERLAALEARPAGQ